MTEILPRSVLIMAGGTGGHVFPALAAANSLRKQGINVEWLGTVRGIEARVVPAANIPIHYISAVGLRGKNLLSLLKAPLLLLRSFWQSVQVIRQLQPVCVLGMGGFASGPGGMAAWLLGRPLVIHEQNAVAGTTNRLLARLAKKVLLGYPITLGGSKSQHIGNPVRAEISALAAPEERGVGQARKLRLLVLGGSLGAKPINDVLPAALHKMSLELRPDVWHQTGAAHIDDVIAVYQDKNLSVKAEPFIGDMAAAYGWADLVFCRAGALTVAEITAAGVASVLVPLPHAIDDHQTANARWLVDNNAATMMPQSTMSAEKLASLLTEYQAAPDKLLSMSKAARAAAKVNAADQVATICMEVACE